MGSLSPLIRWFRFTKFWEKFWISVNISFSMLFTKIPPWKKILKIVQIIPKLLYFFLALYPLIISKYVKRCWMFTLRFTFLFAGAEFRGIAIKATGAITEIHDLQNLRIRSTGLHTEIKNIDGEELKIYFNWKLLLHDILARITRVNSEEHGTKVETVRYSPVSLVGRDSTQSVYSTISSLLQPTVVLSFNACTH